MKKILVKKLNTTTKTIEVVKERVSIDGEEFDLKELWTIINELEGCDGWFNYMVIRGDFHDTKKNQLEKIGLASFNIRGGGRPGKNFTRIKKALAKAGMG
jgi:hypothetical protein